MSHVTTRSTAPDQPTHHQLTDREAAELDEFDAALRETDVLYDLDAASAERFVQSFSRLRTCRVQQGLTQRDVADRMGTVQSAVSDLERGVPDPRVSTLRRYAAALGLFTNIEFTDTMPIPQFAAVLKLERFGDQLRAAAIFGNRETITTWQSSVDAHRIEAKKFVHK